MLLSRKMLIGMNKINSMIELEEQIGLIEIESPHFRGPLNIHTRSGVVVYNNKGEMYTANKFLTLAEKALKNGDR